MEVEPSAVVYPTEYQPLHTHKRKKNWIRYTDPATVEMQLQKGAGTCVFDSHLIDVVKTSKKAWYFHPDEGVLSPSMGRLQQLLTGVDPYGIWWTALTYNNGNKKDLRVVNIIPPESEDGWIPLQRLALNGICPNLFRRRDDGVVEILLNGGRVMLLDDEDLDKVLTLTCTLTFTSGYTKLRFEGKDAFFHRWLVFGGNIKWDSSNSVDHIDRNKLNNTRVNLRVCSTKVNMNNRPMMKSNKTGFNGISCYLRKNKSAVAVATYTQHGIKKNKRVCYGKSRTKEEALQLVVAFRVAHDAETGCRNGYEPSTST